MSLSECVRNIQGAGLQDVVGGVQIHADAVRECARHVHTAGVACPTRVRTPSTLLNAPPSASNRLSAVRVRVSLRRLRSRPLEEAAGQEVESPDKLAEETL